MSTWTPRTSDGVWARVDALGLSLGAKGFGEPVGEGVVVGGPGRPHPNARGDRADAFDGGFDRDTGRACR
ncbi:hypothetical protein ACFXAZ_10360 [Streptomyces sp. NPDC059477]|uniref:hypothetical protein n=1 Tax=Streptomyces sp. NPDC059477 TaxID=3346847 RepID=UPI0036793874